MTFVPVAEISLASTGLINVTPQIPPSEGFEFIYRTATGVRWLTAERCFAPARKAELTHAAWFEEIVAAAAGEYGVQLQITPNTKWRDVPNDIRAEIESHATRSAV